MDIITSITENSVKVIGEFLYAQHRSFKEATDVLISSNPEKIGNSIIDLTEVTRLDSAALGMLLMYRSQVKDSYSGPLMLGVKVQHLSQPHSLLEVANFGKLFNLIVESNDQV